MEKRELLEAINMYGETYHAARCFPYKPGYPMPKAAEERAQRGMTRRSCNSRHDCPVCTSKYMAQRREEFIKLMTNWISDGGSVHWMTLTLRTNFSEDTRTKYQNLSRTWTQMNKRRSFQKEKKQLAPESVRVLEEAFTDDGWFPHYHVAWFFPPKVNHRTAKTFMDNTKIHWCETANTHTRHGASMKGQYQGAVNQQNPRALADYLFKHGFFDVTFDAHQDALGPFELARGLVSLGLADGWEHWRNFSRGSDGLNRVRLSNGLVQRVKSWE